MKQIKNLQLCSYKFKTVPGHIRKFTGIVFNNLLKLYNTNLFYIFPKGNNSLERAYTGLLKRINRQTLNYIFEFFSKM
jgi:hypothetical protein